MTTRVDSYERRGDRGQRERVRSYVRREGIGMGMGAKRGLGKVGNVLAHLEKGPASWIDPKKLHPSDPLLNPDKWDQKYSAEAPWPGNTPPGERLHPDTLKVLHRDYKSKMRPIAADDRLGQDLAFGDEPEDHSGAGDEPEEPKKDLPVKKKSGALAKLEKLYRHHTGIQPKNLVGSRNRPGTNLPKSPWDRIAMGFSATEDSAVDSLQGKVELSKAIDWLER